MINGVSLETLNACPKFEERPKPWCTTCVPYGSFDSDHLDLPANQLAQARYFHPDWTMKTPDDFSVVFSVKGNTDARVYISQFMNETNQDAFEVIFGDVSNSFMTINIWQQGVASFMNTAPIYHGQMLSETKYRDFWINFHEGDLSAGYGRNVFRNIISSWRVDGLFASVAWQFSKACHYKWDMKYVSFTGFEAPVHYKNIVFGKGQFPRESEDAPPSTLAYGYEQFNQQRCPGTGCSGDLANVIELSSRSFEIVLEIQHLSDTKVAFLKTYKVDEVDMDAYEVIFNEAYERRVRSYKRNAIQLGIGHGNTIFAESNYSTWLNPVTFRPVWIKLENQQLRVGEGIVVGESEFMRTGPELLPLMKQDTLVVGFSSYFLASAVRVLAFKSHHGDFHAEWRAKELSDYQLDECKGCKPVTFETGTDAPWQVPIVAKRTHPSSNVIVDPPETKYGHLIKTSPARFQWWYQGAFCAELALQSGLFSLGVYASQGQIRKWTTTTHSSHYFGEPATGYEVTPSNIEPMLATMGLNVDVWNWRKYAGTGEGYKHYFRWVKKHIVQDEPVLWFVKYSCAFDFAHSQLVVGYYSDMENAATNPEVSTDDFLGYLEGTVAPDVYHIQIEDLVDTGAKKNGLNCTMGSSDFCTDINVQVGYALQGRVDPKQRTIKTSLNVNDGATEPVPPFVIDVTATVTVHGPLTKGVQYVIYRYDGLDFPRDSNFEGSQFTKAHVFEADDTTYTWVDLDTFRSDSITSYVTIRYEEPTSNSDEE